MCGNDNGLALFIELQEQIDNLLGVVGVEISGRLVPEDDVRIVNECSGDTDTLRFSSGERFDETFLLVKKSDSGEDFRNFLRDVNILISAHFHGKRHILANGLRSKEFIVLKYNSDASTISEQLLFRIGVDIFISRDEKLSGFRFEISDKHLDEAGLPAPGSADEEDEFSRVDNDIGIFEDVFIPVRQSDIFYFHERYMIITAHIIQKKDILQAMFARYLFL